MKNALTGVLFGALLLQAASFDVASIKPSDAPPGSSGVSTSDGLVRAHNVTLKRCISGAYGVPEAQIVDGPKWMDDLRFEIVAKAGYPAGDTEMMVMLQTLLAERFQLKLHRDSQTVSGYSLTLAKGGLKAKVSEGDGGASTNSSRGRIEATKCTMARLAMKLAAALKVPVVDMTEETRAFDLTLQWVPDEMLAKAASGTDAASGPSLFTALQEQLGLKLEARKIPVGVLVVDHAELPSEN